MRLAIAAAHLMVQVCTSGMGRGATKFEEGHLTDRLLNRAPPLPVPVLRYETMTLVGSGSAIRGARPGR